jgi:tripartite-type tricarboxylate transporter receptor subunit TctC
MKRPVGALYVLMMVSFALHATVASAQSYPTKPIRIVVPFGAGGGADLMTRFLAQRMTASLGVSVVVDNRPGGGGLIGTQIGATAAPDGYTLVEASATTLAVLPLMTKAPYDAQKDLAPITMMGVQPHVVLVHPSVPVKSLQELVAYAKSKPGDLNYASSGNGGPNHLGTELFKLEAGIQMTHVPYKGNGPALTDLLGGQVQLSILTVAPSLPHIKAGKLRALAATSPARLPVLPDLPTVAELGYPGYEVRSWYGLLTPARTPRAIITKLHHEIAAILKQREAIEGLRAQGIDAIGNSPEEFAKHVRNEINRWGRVIKAINLRLD